MASLVLLTSKLDTQCLGLFSSPGIIKRDCELQLLGQYFAPLSSASQLKAQLSWKQNPAASRKERGCYLAGGIHCFTALKVESMLMEKGSSDSSEAPAFVPRGQLNPPFACAACSGETPTELFRLETG